MRVSPLCHLASTEDDAANAATGRDDADAASREGFTAATFFGSLREKTPTHPFKCSTSRRETETERERERERERQRAKTTVMLTLPAEMTSI